MNQLSGRFVNVVLAVEEGKGMDFLKNDVYITASFNGRILESDKMEARDKPVFNTELVWEVEKKELRKIRSSNEPLRVECHTVDQNNRKERVGFSLLSLRSAQIVPVNFPLQKISYKWQKFIGGHADKKKVRPQLYLSLTIRDHHANERPKSAVVPYFVSDEIDAISIPIIDSPTPINYLENGYIQIGDPERATHPFALTFLVSQAQNLDTLLPEVLVFHENNENYYLSFTIFGVTIKSKPFLKELHEIVELSEKVVVKVLSQIDILRDFFETQEIVVNFHCGLDILGTTTIDLKDIGRKSLSNNDFALDTCFLKFPSPNGIVPVDINKRSPFIEVKKALWDDVEDRPKIKTVVSNIPKFLMGSGDQGHVFGELERLEKVTQKAKSDNAVKAEEVYRPKITKSADTVIKNVALVRPVAPASQDLLVKYTLEVAVRKFTWQKLPLDKRVVFKFFHPKAARSLTVFIELNSEVGQEVQLNNASVKIDYISTAENIKSLLAAWPPKFVLADANNVISEEHTFNTSIFSGSDQAFMSYNLQLVTPVTNEDLADVDIEMTLSGGESDFSPPIFDDAAQTWKRPNVNFGDELNRLKEKELDKLRKEYEEKKEDLEGQLNKSMERCRKLQEELQKKLDSFKMEKCLLRHRNSASYHELFVENWSKHGKRDNSEVIEELTKVQRDNDCLKNMLEVQTKKMQVYELSSLTREQTANLLQELRVLEEKFVEVQSAKSYFKEQWKKACEEIHLLRAEDYKQLQNKIQQNREELSQLSLDHFLSDYKEISVEDEISSSRSFY